jgi:formylglycine-generating enzyme required for sulfatase activity
MSPSMRFAVSGLFALALLALLATLPGRADNTDPEPPGTIKNSIGMQFAYIPRGKFMMGADKDEQGRTDDELPRHEVEITKSFNMGIHEVTQKQFKEVMGRNPSHYTGNDDFPVESVTWSDAVDFCKKLSELATEKKAGRKYRLPTEAEWEYACRATTTTPYHFGKTITKELANRTGGHGKTCKVGSYKPNKWGLYDMHGNVWEWCSDWFDSGYYNTSPKKDPTGPAKGEYHTLRGGCHVSDATLCRAAKRNHDNDKFSRNSKSIVGFRVVCVRGGS